MDPSWSDRRVVAVVLPVVEIGFDEVFRADNEEVLCVLLLGGLGEVEGAGDHDRPVDKDDLVMGDSVLGIDIGRNAGIHQKSGRRVLPGLLTLIKDHFDLDPPLVRVEQGLCDRGGGE